MTTPIKIHMLSLAILAAINRKSAINTTYAVRGRRGRRERALSAWPATSRSELPGRARAMGKLDGWSGPNRHRPDCCGRPSPFNTFPIFFQFKSKAPS
jgi:hypothetical protein